MRAIKWEHKRWDWNTKSRWAELGYRVNEGVSPVGELKTKHNKRERYPLYSFEQVTALPGKRADHKRFLWHYNSIKGWVRDWSQTWVDTRKPFSGWNNAQWDDAIYEESIKIESRVYRDHFGNEMVLTITQREMLRGEFEKSALAALDREYSSYPYGVGIL